MNEDNEIIETEGELLAREAATDSPFSGYGRPFSDDSLGTSDAYSHDNPANNVGPYSGPSSYSINTVVPYHPPHGGEENPGQNVGPYKTPNPDDEPSEDSMADEEVTPNSVRQAYKDWNQKQWFDGTSISIYDRLLEAEQIQRQAATSGDFEVAEELREQVEVLSKTAAEYDDSSLREFVEEVPGGTVALEYDDLIDGGLVDVTSFLSTGAYRVAHEAANYDWDTFKTEGARMWITHKIADNPGLIKHEVVAREAAVDYAKDKTMVLMDPVRRADIIDGFVTAAEVFRREAAKRLLEDEEETTERKRQFEAAKVAQVTVEYENGLDFTLPGEYVEIGPDYDADGYWNIGEDDGTQLWAEAHSAIESTKRDWEHFTTEGAREWFFDKAIDSPMTKHVDITQRAAKAYASEQVAGVPDSALKKEIVRAFSESVEFLRNAHVIRESNRKPQEDTGIDEFFGDELLW